MNDSHRLLRNWLGAAAVVAAASVVLTLIATQVLFNGAAAHPQPEAAAVRISAFKHDDGAYTVALQALNAENEWSERHLPRLRFVRPDAETNRWITSSALEVRSGGPRPLYCVVAHGAENDRFWTVLRSFLHQSAHVTKAKLHFETHLDGSDQAAAIQRCSAEGAAVIAATLADPDAVRGSLLAAKEAGSRIITFNAGVEHANTVGSEIHIALNDPEAGRAAGRAFNEGNIVGTVGCLIHESGNIGLVHRCDGLAETFKGGEVVVIRLDEEASTAAQSEAIAARLADPDEPAIAALLALNSKAKDAAMDAATQTYGETGRLILVSSVSGPVDAVRDLQSEERSRHLFDLLINDSADSQGFLLLTAMEFVHHYPLPARFVAQAQLHLAVPSTFDISEARNDPSALQAAFQNYLELIESDVDQGH